MAGINDQLSTARQSRAFSRFRPFRIVPVSAVSVRIPLRGLAFSHLAPSPQGGYPISMTNDHLHASHPKISARLKRAEGHLRAVIAMIEAGRPCLDIAQQLQAVESAVANAKRSLIHDHMDHCLDADSSETDRAELRAISRYL